MKLEIFQKSWKILNFSCSDVEGNDVVQLLQQAIERRGDVKIEVCAILNDTTGCLMSCAWKDERCRVGLILGTFYIYLFFDVKIIIL